MQQEQQQGAVVAAVVKWYEPLKGFGFAACDDKTGDVFLHRSCVKACGIRELNAGDRVEVRWKETPKGRQATTIKLTNTTD
jgi:CspA family cold shock protein